jgi:hypothetical protein
MVSKGDLKLSNFILKQMLGVASTIPVDDNHFVMCVDNIMGCIDIIDLHFTGGLREGRRRDLWSIIPLFTGKSCVIILSDQESSLHLNAEEAILYRKNESPLKLF